MPRTGMRRVSNALVTAKAAHLYHVIGHHLGLAESAVEEYWPGSYELTLMHDLDYVADVEQAHCAIMFPRECFAEHNYRAPLPEATRCRMMKAMESAHQKFRESRYRERIAEIIQSRQDKREEAE